MIDVRAVRPATFDLSPATPLPLTSPRFPFHSGGLRLMHERTTRAIARWLFVVCCAMPTCLTMIVIVVTWTPWYDNRVRHALEDRLAMQTGLRVEIGRFERSDPTTWRLYDVLLFNAETEQSVATIRAVCWIAGSDITVIHLSQPEINVRSIGQLADLVHDRFLCRPERTSVPVRIAADDLTLKGTSGSQTLRDVDAHLETEHQRVWASIRCIPAGHRPDVDGLNIEISRDRTASPPLTRWSMQTGELSLPMSFLGDYFPFVNQLGDDAMFRGFVSADRPDRHMNRTAAFQLSGRFEDIDMGRLTAELPHRVTGRASVSLDRCQIDADGGVNVAGELRSREGWMSASLMPRLAEDLGCELKVMTDTDFNFDALALRFELYASQLRIEGLCRTQPGNEWLPAGVIVAVAGHPIVVSQDTWLPATNLARLIAPPHSVRIPISSQTSGLLSILKPPRNALPSMPTDATSPESTEEPPTEPAARIGRLQRLQGTPLVQPF